MISTDIASASDKDRSFPGAFGIAPFRRLLGLDPLQQFFRHPFAPLGIHLSAPLQKFLDKQILIVPQPIISPEPILFFLRQRKCREATLPFFLS